jgi:hypothetical protein
MLSFCNLNRTDGCGQIGERKIFLKAKGPKKLTEKIELPVLMSLKKQNYLILFSNFTPLFFLIQIRSAKKKFSAADKITPAVKENPLIFIRKTTVTAEHSKVRIQPL